MRVTTSGIVFLIAGLSLCIAAYRFSLASLLPVGVLLIFLTVFSLLFALVAGGRLHVDVRALVPSVGGRPLTYVGHDTDVRVTLTNSLPVPTGSFYLDVQPMTGFGAPQGVQVPSVPAMGTVSIDATFTPSARGLRGVKQVTVAMDGPFRLTQYKRSVAHDYEVAVAPPQVALAHPSRSGQPRPLAESNRMSRGLSTRDFYTRDYVPGDDLRHVHWKTVARTGHLVVRQEADEDNPAAAVIVHGEGMTNPVEFDLLVAAAMSAVHTYARAGYHVHVVMGQLTAEALPGDRNRNVDALAAHAQAQAATLPSARTLRSLSEVVICSLDHDHSPTLPGARRVRTHRWYASDVNSETLGDMNFSGIFGGDITVPAQWNLRGI